MCNDLTTFRYVLRCLNAKNMFVSEFSLLISGYFRDNVNTNVPSLVDKKIKMMVQGLLLNQLTFYSSCRVMLMAQCGVTG